MANLPIEFIVDVPGETSGETFKGVFKAIPRLSHSANLRRDQLRRDLLGPKAEEAGPDAVNVAVVFSKVWAHLTETPSWWRESRNGLDLLDESPVAAVYDNVTRIEREAFEAVKKKADAAKGVLAEEIKP